MRNLAPRRRIQRRKLPSDARRAFVVAEKPKEIMDIVRSCYKQATPTRFGSYFHYFPAYDTDRFSSH